MSEVHSHTPLIDPELWHLDPALQFLNHGSYGACPKEILEVQRAIQLSMERSPVHFMLQQLPELTRKARECLSDLLSADPEHLVFVSNASEGVATALDAISWRSGDEVVLSQDSYPACRHMLTELSKRHGLKIKVALTPFAGVARSRSKSEHHQMWDQEICEAFRAQCNERTRLILIDHITSPTALIYPVRQLIELANEFGAVSLVDGAHA